MQIESLWRFTAKYDPEWVGRYLAFGSVEHVLSVGLAVARAESFWELPVIGRYLRPGRPTLRARIRPDAQPKAA
jgi:lysyl-tRNA synthetase class 2